MFSDIREFYKFIKWSLGYDNCSEPKFRDVLLIDVVDYIRTLTLYDINFLKEEIYCVIQSEMHTGGYCFPDVVPGELEIYNYLEVKHPFVYKVLCKMDEKATNEYPNNPTLPGEVKTQKGRTNKNIANIRGKLLGSDTEKEETLKILHRLIDGKKGKDVALVIYACVRAGKMLKPTYPMLKNEFGEIGHYSGYNAYYKDASIKFTENEVNDVVRRFSDKII